MHHLAVSGLIILGILGIGGLLILDRQYQRRMIALARERSGESICQFVRSLPFQQLDFLVIRHVYEQIQQSVSAPGWLVPIHASDRFDRTYSVSVGELGKLVQDTAQLCGRSLAGYERNPYFPRLRTVADLVHFLCEQPRIVSGSAENAELLAHAC